jgi:hypothetical protein
MKREHKVELLDESKKEKFMVTPLWHKYSVDYAPLNSSYSNTYFDTLEEAQAKILTEKGRGKYAIVKVFGIYEGRSRPIILEGMRTRKFAVFVPQRFYQSGQTIQEITYCGVIDAYDHADVKQLLQNNNKYKSQAKIFAIGKDGKIVSRDKISSWLRNARKVENEWDKDNKNDYRCYANAFQEIDLREMM